MAAWGSWRALLVPGVVAVAAALWFGFSLDSEPFFADESAHIAQTNYFRLLAEGNVDDPAWLHPAAYDHGPIYKYLLGAGFYLTGREAAVPRSTTSWEWWMAGHFDPPSDPSVLITARRVLMFGAIAGCVALFAIGKTLRGVPTGLAAAALLAASPLYFTHARRAMADDLTQAFVLLGLWSFYRASSSEKGALGPRVGWCLASGAFSGLAAATKLNGATALVAILGFVIASSLAQGRSMRWIERARTVLVGVLVASAAAATFVGVNPYLYARPSEDQLAVSLRSRPPELEREIRELASAGVLGRARHMLRHRTSSIEESMPRFADYALPTIPDRARAIVREGMGRWSAFGRLPFPAGVRSTMAAALVLLGMIVLWSQGRRQASAGRVPAPWLFCLWPLVEAGMLLGTLKLDWDRYYMGVVAWTSLLPVIGIAGLVHGFWDRLVLKPPGIEQEASG